MSFPGDSFIRGCNYVLRRLAHEREPIEIHDLFQNERKTEAIRKKLGVSKKDAEHTSPQLILDFCVGALEQVGWVECFESDRFKTDGFDENNNYQVALTEAGREVVRDGRRVIFSGLYF